MPGGNRLRIGRREAVTGLLWQPAQERIPIRKQARLAGGQQSGFDLYASFGVRKQYGFAARGDGCVAGMLAAASLCDGLDWGDNWLAAFSVPGQYPAWWIVAQRNGAVFEDQLHSDVDKARAAFLKSLEAPDWDRIIAPDSWDVGDAAEVPLGKALSFAAAVKLRPVNRWPRTAALAALALSAAGAAYLGYSASLDWRQSRIAEPVRPPEEPPWHGSPGLSAFIFHCAGEMNRLSIPVPGWHIQHAECGRSGEMARTRVRWKREGGNPSWLLAATGEKAGLPATLLTGGQLAELAQTKTVERRLPRPSPRAQHPLLFEKRLRDRFQTLGLELQLTPAAGFHSLSIATSAGVGEFAELLNDIPALTPQSLLYRPKANSWLLKARIYHPLTSPEQES